MSSTEDASTSAMDVFPTQAAAEARYIAIFGTRTRFVLLVLVLLCLTSIWSSILSFNFAVICMSPGNTTDPDVIGDSYAYTSGQKSLGIAIVAIAALLGNFPVVQLINRFGIRTVFAVCGVLSALSTLAIPTAIRLGFYWFLAARFVQGFAFAANFPVIGSFCAKWTYFKQNGLFVSCLVAYVQLSPAFTNPASGALCEAFRWPAVFYAHGAVSLLLFVTYGLFYRNSPQKHPFVGTVELRKISVGKISAVDKRALMAIPYGPILRDTAVWAVWIGSFGNFFCVNMMFLFSPIYLSTVLGFPVHKTGLSAAIPPIAQFLMKLICGAISDRIKCVSEQNKFRLFNSLAFFGSCCFLVALGLQDGTNKNMCMLLLGGAAGILGATTGGFFKAGPVISKQYSHFVTGNISLGLTITMLIIPFVVNTLTPNNTQDEWRYVFFATGAVMVICNLIFCFFVKGEACVWTRDDFVAPNRVAVVPSQNSPASARNGASKF